MSYDHWKTTDPADMELGLEEDEPESENMTKAQMKDAEYLRQHLQDIGRKLKRELPPGFAFILLISSVGEEGVTLYLSTVERADALQVMREFVANNMEERNWQREMPELEIHQEFEAWWEQQKKRNREDLSLKDWCADAFNAGRASA